MKKVLLVSVIALSLSRPAMAADKEFEKESLIGFGAGATMGALVGGPVGAMAGGIIGIFIGKIEGDKDELAKQQDAISNQQQTIIALQDKSADYDSLMASNQMLETKLTHLTQQRIDSLLALSVQFRTGSDKIEPHFAQQLIELAEVMKQQPHIHLDLNGFADQRGDEQHNLLLSTQRAQNVAAFLIDHGVSQNRLSTHGFGESQSIAKQNSEDSVESNVFDRRVTVHAHMQQDNQTANNQF
jgi:sortase system peptidoglycan-associated protein